MKREFLLIIILSVVCSFILWKAISFQQEQECIFSTALKERDFFQKKYQALKQNLILFKSHQKEINELHTKGWLTPHSRLIAAKFLETLRPLFKEMSYQFDPETIQESFRVTKVLMECESVLDLNLYIFLDTLLEKFPGVLIPREVHLTRKKEDPTCITGKFLFEWVAAEPLKDGQ